VSLAGVVAVKIPVSASVAGAVRDDCCHVRNAR
jgi:hypothetical protein